MLRMLPFGSSTLVAPYTLRVVMGYVRRRIYSASICICRSIRPHKCAGTKLHAIRMVENSPGVKCWKVQLDSGDILQPHFQNWIGRIILTRFLALDRIVLGHATSTQPLGTGRKCTISSSSAFLRFSSPAVQLGSCSFGHPDTVINSYFLLVLCQ